LTPALESYTFDDEGYSPLLMKLQWMIAILNWEPSTERDNLKEIERHNLSDEVFVLLRGQVVLILHPDGEALTAHNLQPNSVYNVPAGVWHNVILSRDAKVLIVENNSTHLHDTETRPITPEEFRILEMQLMEGHFS
jgi:ureidoglycolate hydrolase